SLVNTDVVAAHRDHPLDVALRGVARVAEDNNIAARDRLQPVDKLIDEDALLVGQPREHARALHLHRLIKKNDDESCDQQRDHQVAHPSSQRRHDPECRTRLRGPRHHRCAFRFLPWKDLWFGRHATPPTLYEYHLLITELPIVGVMSRGLCKNLEGAVFPFQVEALEDGVDDSVHAVYVHKAHHGPGTPPDLDKAALDDVGGAQLPPQVPGEAEE